MTVKSSISLTDEQDAFARSLVEKGRYPSVSAVVQQGLDLLRTKTESEELEIEALRRLLRKRDRGPFISDEEMKHRIDKMAERKRRALGL